MKIAENKMCILINKEWDDSKGKSGTRKEFPSICEAEKYLRFNGITAGRLTFTKVQTWRTWDTIDEADFLRHGYGRGTRVALYTNSNWRIETFKEGDEIKNTMPEILEILNNNANKPFDLSDLRKRKTDKTDKEQEKIDAQIKKSILRIYAECYTGRKRVMPRHLERKGIRRSDIKRLFSGMEDIDRQSRNLHAEEFFDFKVRDIYTQEYMDDFNDLVEGGEIKRFLVTTAVTSCNVDPALLESMRTYCALNNAELLIMLSTDPVAKVNSFKQGLDKLLKDEYIIFEETSLNDNLSLCAMRTSAKMINPTFGVKRLVHTKGSIIVASPKQKLDIIPTGNKSFPHAEMTTGAITKPNYETDRYMSERTAYLAEFDHVMGGIIVEIQDDKIFHFRQFQADRNGHFADLGVKYTPSGKEPYAPEAFVLGDLHVGETDPIALNAWYDVQTLTGVNRLVIHDLFNGKSISHHNRKKQIKRAVQMMNNELTLEEEIRETASMLNELCERVDELVIVKSNHDEFLDRYLEDGCFMKEPQNYYFSLVLAKAVFEGNDPLKYGLEYAGFKYPEKVVWLERDEDYKIDKVQLGSHGDAGNNGSRGSIISMETAFGNSVTGHRHTPGILRGAWVVGTSTYLQLDYNRGASSWMQSSCLVYPNGTKQLINVVEGNWHLE